MIAATVAAITSQQLQQLKMMRKTRIPGKWAHPFFSMSKRWFRHYFELMPRPSAISRLLSKETSLWLTSTTHTINATEAHYIHTRVLFAVLLSHCSLPNSLYIFFKENTHQCNYSSWPWQIIVQNYQPLPKKKVSRNIALLLPPLFFLQPTLTTAFFCS